MKNPVAKIKNAVDYHAGNMMFAVEAQKSIQRKTLTKFSKSMGLVMIACLLLMISCVPAFADTPGGTGGNTANLMGQLVGIIVTMFRWVGIMLLVWGITQFVMAVKRTDSESKSDAIQTIICAIVLMALKTIVTNLGLGITVSDANF